MGGGGPLRWGGAHWIAFGPGPRAVALSPLILLAVLLSVLGVAKDKFNAWRKPGE